MFLIIRIHSCHGLPYGERKACGYDTPNGGNGIEEETLQAETGDCTPVAIKQTKSDDNNNEFAFVNY